MKHTNMKEATFFDKLKCPYVWLTAMSFAMQNGVTAYAASGEAGGSGSTVDFQKAANPVIGLINQVLGPLIGVVAAIGAVYCVILGVKLAKADEPQEREKSKMALKNAVIGYFLIFILIVVVRILTPQLANWVDSNAANGTPKIGGN